MTSPQIRVINVVLEGKGSNFKEIYLLRDAKAFPQATELAELFQSAVNKEMHFDFEKALNIAKDKKDMMAVVKTLNQTITKQNVSTTAMMQELVKLLIAILGFDPTEGQRKELNRAIRDALVNLEKEQASPWVSWRTENSHKVAYTYNLLLIIQGDNTGLFLAEPIGIDITVDISKQELFGIKLEDKHNFGVTVKGICAVRPLS
jgi:hypothetical protein